MNHHIRSNVFLILDEKENAVGMLVNGITYRLEKCDDEETMEIMHNGGDRLPLMPNPAMRKTVDV